MRKTAVILLTAVMICAALLGACGPADDDGSAPDDTGAAGSLPVGQVQGNVLEVELSEPTRVLVDSKAEVEGLIWVTITNETDFFEDLASDSSLGISDISRDFAVGNQVVFYVDAIAESYPMQTTALACYENSPR